MNALIEQFLDHVSLERGLSANTLAAYTADLTAFERFIGKKRISSFNSVKRRDVLDFLSRERERGLSVSSVSRRLVAVKLLFKYLEQESLLAGNVTAAMDSPRLARILPATLTFKEVTRLLESPVGDDKYSIRDRAILEMMYGTGMRVSECADLRLDDIHSDSGYLRCRGKGNKVRIVPYGATAAKRLSTYLRDSRPDLLKGEGERRVFLTYRGKGFSRKGIWLLIKKHARRAGIAKTISPHTLRHSFASHLLANGASLRVIQELLGHADIATTQVYTHIDQNMLKSVHSQYHPRG